MIKVTSYEQKPKGEVTPYEQSLKVATLQKTQKILTVMLFISEV